MRTRLLELMSVAMVILAVVAFLELTSVPVSGQAPTAAKTAWGEPDLQGIWSDDYQIPLERPAQYAGKAFFTEAEIAEIDKQRAASLGRDQRQRRGSEGDVNGAYNDVFVSTRRTGRSTSLIVDPPDGKIPPLTPEAAKRRSEERAFRVALLQATDACKNQRPACAGGAYGPPSPKRNEAPPHYSTSNLNRADGPEDRSFNERCMSGKVPDFDGGGLAGAIRHRIVQSPGFVSIYYDARQGQGFHRVIPITTAPHLPASVRQWWGDSRGRWEGDTLVVDVTNFTPKHDNHGTRGNLHYVERWTRTGPDTIQLVATFDDPTVWTKPWTVKEELSRQDNAANRIYQDNRCHEGNYGLVGVLVGARAEDKAFAEGRGPDPATRGGGGE